jgi:hypothetical protein
MMDLAATLTIQPSDYKFHQRTIVIDKFTRSATSDSKFSGTNGAIYGFTAPYIKELSVLGLRSNRYECTINMLFGHEHS